MGTKLVTPNCEIGYSIVILQRSFVKKRIKYDADEVQESEWRLEVSGIIRLPRAMNRVPPAGVGIYEATCRAAVSWRRLMSARNAWWDEY